MRYLFLVLGCILSLMACQNRLKLKTMEDLSKHIFSVLARLPTSQFEDFQLDLMPYEKIEQISKEVYEKSLNNPFSYTSKERLQAEIQKSFLDLREQAVKKGIVWNNIVYMDFISEFIFEQVQLELKQLKGNFYFKHENKSFSIEVYALWHRGSYELMSLGDLKSIN